ncbi:MAG TPA: hypothetical protein VD967_02015 [Candidatus Paceibacterota bacterium]|nr:hypothetical protein [Candidatus Paceibacterota bacterium]
MISFSRAQCLQLSDFEKEVREIYLSLTGNLAPENRLESVEKMTHLLELLHRWVKTFVRIVNKSSSQHGYRISEQEARLLYGTAAIAFGTALALCQEAEFFIEAARPNYDGFTYEPIFRAEKQPLLH